MPPSSNANRVRIEKQLWRRDFVGARRSTSTNTNASGIVLTASPGNMGVHLPRASHADI